MIFCGDFFGISKEYIIFVREGRNGSRLEAERSHLEAERSRLEAERG